MTNQCCERPSIKTLTTDAGAVYACERCSRHWFRTYAEAAGMTGAEMRYPPDEPTAVPPILKMFERLTDAQVLAAMKDPASLQPLSQYLQRDAEVSQLTSQQLVEMAIGHFSHINPEEQLLLFELYSRVWPGWVEDAPEVKSPPHTTEDDFRHFLAYEKLSGQPPEELQRLRLAYYAGADKGVPKEAGEQCPGNCLHWCTSHTGGLCNCHSICLERRVVQKSEAQHVVEFFERTTDAEVYRQQSETKQGGMDALNEQPSSKSEVAPEDRCVIAGCLQPVVRSKDGAIGALCEFHNGNVGLRGD